MLSIRRLFSISAIITIMQIFGLLSLLITIAVAGWWLSVGMGPASTTTNEDGKTVQQQTYQDAIESAEDVVSKTKTQVQNEIKKVETKPASGPQIDIYNEISVDKNIKTLSLANRDLSGSLKAEIRHLESLQELDLSHNNFTGLPAEIGQLSQLKVLNLSYNPLTGLPYEIGNLSKLELLDLRGTNYTEADLNVIKSKLPATTKVLID